MRPKRLVNYRFHAVARYHSALGMALDVFRRDDFFGGYDDAAGSLRLFLILPLGAVNLAVSLAVCYLDVNERYVRRQSFQQDIFFACKRTLPSTDVVRRRNSLQPLQRFTAQQGFTGNEGKTQRPGHVLKANRKTCVVVRFDRPAFARPVDARDGAETVERSASDDQALHQACSDQQVSVHAHNTLRECQVFFLVPNELVSKCDYVASDGKAAKSYLRAIRDRTDHLANRFHFVSQRQAPAWNAIRTLEDPRQEKKLRLSEFARRPQGPEKHAWLQQTTLS